MVVRLLVIKNISVLYSLLIILLLFQFNVEALDLSTDSKILAVVKNYQSAIEQGDVKTLLDNFTESQQEIMQPCLADKQCADELSKEVLFVKLKDFKVGTIRDSVEPPGKLLSYSATRIFGEPNLGSQQRGSGELRFVQETDDWKIAAVTWVPSTD